MINQQIKISNEEVQNFSDSVRQASSQKSIYSQPNLKFFGLLTEHMLQFWSV